MKDEWSLDDLAARFPDRCRTTGPQALASRPAAASDGDGAFEDDEATPPTTVKVSVTVAPAPAFSVRLGHRWPAALLPSQPESLQRGILRGILLAGRVVYRPSPIGSCAIMVTAVTCDALSTERAAHYAAYYAVRDAFDRCAWRSHAEPFPVVPIAPDEDLDLAYRRVVDTFQANGFDLEDGATSAVGDLGPRLEGWTRWFVLGPEPPVALPFPEKPWRAFVFVCPSPWTDALSMDVARALDRLSGRADYSSPREYAFDAPHEYRYHFLSAYRLPRAIVDRGDVSVSGG